MSNQSGLPGRPDGAGRNPQPEPLSLSACAGRLLEQLPAEAERMRRVPGIIFVEQITGRRPRIAGSGVDVFEVVRDYLDYGRDRAAVVQTYDHLTPEQIDAALAYSKAYSEEIDAWLTRAEQITRAVTKQHS